MTARNLSATFIVILFLAASAQVFAQVHDTSNLFKVIKSRDSLLFNAGFNNCDIRQFEDLVSDSFEFYHDEAGETRWKADFINGIRDGLCKLPYKPIRRLIDSTLEIYPLEKNGVLYAAVENGVHQFYALEPGKPEYLTSTAKFMSLWRLEHGVWKLSRVVSYDHVQPVKGSR